jgi:SAM-dependent methyltransferase
VSNAIAASWSNEVSKRDKTLSRQDADIWNQRYRDGAYASRTHPNEFLAKWLPEVPEGAALDVACGSGRNAVYLANAGFDVSAVDISQVALNIGAARLAGMEAAGQVTWIQQDLDQPDLPAGPFQLIIMLRYVNTPLISELIDRLAPGGYLLIEEHLQTDEPTAGPRSSRFRVAPGELSANTTSCEVVHYHEGISKDPDGQDVALAQFVGLRR